MTNWNPIAHCNTVLHPLNSWITSWKSGPFLQGVSEEGVGRSWCGPFWPEGSQIKLTFVWNASSFQAPSDWAINTIVSTALWSCCIMSDKCLCARWSGLLVKGWQLIAVALHVHLARVEWKSHSVVSNKVGDVHVILHLTLASSSDLLVWNASLLVWSLQSKAVLVSTLWWREISWHHLLSLGQCVCISPKFFGPDSFSGVELTSKCLLNKIFQCSLVNQHDLKLFVNQPLYREGRVLVMWVHNPKHKMLALV